MWLFCVAYLLLIGKRRVCIGRYTTCTTGEFYFTIPLVLRRLISCRLRDISEDTASQQQPRRRSNSLPIPKIEVSMFQNDNRRQEPKDFIEVPEVKDVSPLAGTLRTNLRNNEINIGLQNHHIIHKNKVMIKMGTRDGPAKNQSEAK